ncbi:MAG: VOC family protein [Deltaproteobacteria bacterium]|nr:VOC family protein [Deltaproteobacteria bacterium]
MPRHKGVNHLVLATRDLPATIRYWRDLLGLRLVAGLGREGGRLYFFELSARDLVGFFEWPEVEPVEEKDHGYPAKGPFIFDHLAITVEDHAALWRLKDSLDAAGFWVSEVIDHGFIHSIYTFDPNGVPLEFSVVIPGFDPRESPALVDREPSGVALEGPDPQPGHWPQPARPTPPEEWTAYPGEGRELLDAWRDKWSQKAGCSSTRKKP